MTRTPPPPACAICGAWPDVRCDAPVGQPAGGGVLRPDCGALLCARCALVHWREDHPQPEEGDDIMATNRTLNCSICDSGASGRYQARPLYEGACARCWLDSVVDGVHQVVECPDAVLPCPACQRLGLWRVPDPLVTTWDCTHCGAVQLCVEDIEEAIREYLGLPSRPVGMVL